MARAKSGMRATVQKKETKKKKMDFRNLSQSAHVCKYLMVIFTHSKWFDRHSKRLHCYCGLLVEESGSLVGEVVEAASQWKVSRCTISPLHC